MFTANATEEFFVRRRPLYEVVGQLGMWGTIINGVQAAGLEHNGMRTANWSGENSMHTTQLNISCTVLTLMDSRTAHRVHRCDVHPLHSGSIAIPHGLFSLL